MFAWLEEEEEGAPDTGPTTQAATLQPGNTKYSTHHTEH